VAALEEKAEAAYREAAAVEEKLVPNWPRVDDYRHNLARSYTRLSLLLVRDPKRIDLAADFRRKAIPHWEKLLDQDPRFADYHVGLIGCFYDEALYQLRIGEKDAAIQWGEKAVKRQETLADGFPKRLDFQVRLARGYNDLGKIYGEKGNAEQEKAHYDLALSKLEGIKAKADAPVTDWSQAMADVNKDIGVMRAIRQDYTQALPSFQKALQHQREALDAKSTYEVKQNLVDLAISTTDLQVKLKDAPGVSATAAEVEPFLREFKWRQGLDLFSLARRVARCIPITDGKDQKKYADQAMRLLEAAVEQGLEAMQALRNPDFSPLFDRVDYQRLLKGKG
jgi:tetratricopeptide (TPR) repeat protein